MGGSGSGHYCRVFVKDKVEDYRSIDANEFSRWGYLRQGSHCRSILRWLRAEREIASCGFLVKIDDINDSIVFFYEFNGEKHADVKVDLSWYSPGFGGRRYLFVCPHCGRRMRTLHFKHGEIACRVCHNLTYESCVENHNFDNLCKGIAVGLNASWYDVKRCMKSIKAAWRKEPKRPRGRPRKQT